MAAGFDREDITFVALFGLKSRAFPTAGFGGRVMYAMKAGGSEAHGEAKRQPIKFFADWTR